MKGDLPPSCRVCGHLDYARVFEGRELMFGLGDSFEYGVCSRCGSLSLLRDDFPVARYYPEAYYSFREAAPIPWATRLALNIGQLVPDPLLAGSWLPRRSYSWSVAADLHRELRALSGKRSPSVLEVGCGDGRDLLPLFWAGCLTEGLDPYYRGPDPAHFSIHRCDLAGLEGRYDLIYFRHSLEHMPDPRSILRKAASLLSPRGACVIEIPKLPSTAFEKYREKWFALDAPRHFFIPSVTGLTDLARDCGFLTTEWRDAPAVGSYLWSEAYQRGYTRHGNRLDDLLAEPERNALTAEAERACSRGESCHAVFVCRAEAN